MADPDTPSDPLAELAFEIERFEWIGEDRLEVTGRWFGVRGLRFIRPTLHVRLGERRRRLIALLEDKPWPADGDGPWIASFTWEGPHDGVTAARLEVAPDVVLDLPMPGGDAAGRTLNPRPRPRPKPRKKPAAPRKAAGRQAQAGREDPAVQADRRAATEPHRSARRSAPAAAPAASEARSVAAAPAARPPTVEPTRLRRPPPPRAPPPRAAAPAAAPPRAASPPPRAAPTTAPPAGEPPPLAALEPPADDAPRDVPPATADEPLPSPAAELKALALERRLVEERATRERVEEELAAAREQLAALTEHQASAVERAQEVVRLEGELAAAKRERAEAVARAEAELRRHGAGSRPSSPAERERDEAVARAEAEHPDVGRLQDELAAAREDLADAREPLELAPLPSRFDARRRRPEWGTRAAAVVLVLILLGAFALILSLL